MTQVLNVLHVNRASTTTTLGRLPVRRVQVVITALVVRPVACILQPHVPQEPMQVEHQLACFAVLVNIRRLPVELPIAIKVVFLASTKRRDN